MADLQPDPQPDDFKGSERFRIQRRLGAGGFGVVYEAHDRDNDAVVALKILRRGDAPSLYRFKREFRALADVTHPNLVALYELIGEGALWFFTMEMVEGVDFLEYVWGISSRSAEASSSSSPTRGAGSVIGQTFQDAESTLIQPASSLPARSGPAQAESPSTTIALGTPASSEPEEAARPVRSVPPGGGPQMDRLRDALAQLAAGVLALHDAGKRHCDIKPLNVRVTPEGRVVLLDFGLVSEGPEADPYESGIAGSVSYMSPEQAAGQTLTDETDWYAVGAVLFEALTGTVPFKGPVAEVLRAKQQAEPPPPSRLADGIPRDLDEICHRLLRRNPAERLTGRELLARLGREDARTAGAGRTDPGTFIGRERHLRALGEALAAARTGRTVLVRLHGESGMGKTTLLRRFLEHVEEHVPDAVVLSGRCFERESVPYKGLDTLVEALAHRLRVLPEEARPQSPAGSDSLMRLFPVFGQVSWLAGPAGDAAVLDPLEARRQAVSALRALLGALGRRSPLVLSIDDLQWGDVDSALLMGEVLGPSDRPPLLLLAVYREEEARRSPFLAAVRTLLERAPGALRVDTIEVGTLAPEDAQALARALLRDNAPQLADTIARESQGSALFLTELVRYWHGGGTLGPVTLDGMIRARIDRLSEEERRLLEVVAVAGQPVLVTAARAAAGVAAGEPEVARLRAAHLVRLQGPGPPSLETWHDRIREVVVAELPPQLLRERHLALARALEASRRADPEALAVHFKAAGETDAAAGYAVEAAGRAARALAFDRAARLYRLALAIRGPGHAEEPRLRRELGDALANGGRGAEAADAYLAAVADAGEQEAFDLRRRAAEQLLRAGHIDAGLELMRTVLRAVGLTMARSPRRALLSLLGRRAWLRLRGLRYRERTEAEVPPAELLRIDTCWSMANGLSLVDNVRGADFQARHLLLALRAGEPYRVARALAVEAGHSGTGGSHAANRTRQLVRDAGRLAEQVGHPHALGMSASMAGLSAFLEGQWKTAARETERAAHILRERCSGAAHELAIAHSYNLMALYYLGELRELGRRLPPLMQDAEERGDLFTSLRLRTRLLAATHLAADEPARAQRQVEQAIALWSHRSFYVPHFNAFWARATLGLYVGEALTAWHDVNARWDAFRRSLLLRVQFVRVESWHLRARTALAAVAAGQAAPALLKPVEQDIARIRGERTTWGDALAMLLAAGVAATRGERDNARTLLGRAEAACLANDLGLFAAAARRRRGQLLGGDEGRALSADAEDWMRAQTIVNPERMCVLQVPGRWS